MCCSLPGEFTFVRRARPRAVPFSRRELIACAAARQARGCARSAMKDQMRPDGERVANSRDRRRIMKRRRERQCQTQRASPPTCAAPAPVSEGRSLDGRGSVSQTPPVGARPQDAGKSAGTGSGRQTSPRHVISARRAPEPIMRPSPICGSCPTRPRPRAPRWLGAGRRGNRSPGYAPKGDSNACPGCPTRR